MQSRRKTKNKNKEKENETGISNSVSDVLGKQLAMH